MRTQSLDTRPEFELVMIDMIRKAPLQKRFRLVQSLTQGVLWSNLHAWQQSHRETNEQEAAVHYVSRLYGNVLAQYVKAALERYEQWHLQPSDLLAIISPLVQAFESLRMPYYLGGSIASSLHGMQQMAQDIDLVVDFREQYLPIFLTFLKQNYTFDEAIIQNAVQQRTSFALIHLNTLTKIDIILLRGTAFDLSMFDRVAASLLDERYSPFHIASASEMILWKLYRYQQDALMRIDGMRDDAEWNDILGMLKVQGANTNVDFLVHWAEELNIVGVLKQSFTDAGRLIT